MLSMDASVNGWKSASQINSGTPVAIGMQTMHAVGHANGVNRDRVAGLLTAMSGLIGALPPDIASKDDKFDLPPPARAQLRLMVESLQDLLTEREPRGNRRRATGRDRRHGGSFDKAPLVRLGR